MLFCQAFAIEEIDDKKVFFLDDCIQYAITNSPVIKKAKLNYEISKKDHGISKSAYFPTKHRYSLITESVKNGLFSFCKVKYIWRKDCLILHQKFSWLGRNG